MMEDYKLSASMKGHDDDVRAVCFPQPDLVISASRDASVRTWRLQQPPNFDSSISSTGQAFQTSLAFLPSTSEYPNGLILTGSQDAIIDVREPGKPPDSNAERLLIGHAHNVCALDVSPDRKWIVSGSWDQTARIWEVGKWNDEIVLEGHKGSVWSVLAYANETVITACADHMIRVYSNTGKLLHSFQGSTDVVRALCKLPNGNPLGADFASAGNDGIIHLWNIKGTHVAQLNGHESFIYSLACLPNGDIISSGEDRTVRIWRQTTCLQTITHPAISVWCVAVNTETSDIVSGTSDRTVRVFTKDAKRLADAETLTAFEDAVKGSSIPQQQVGNVNKEKLPGPNFLKQKSGTKEGQVVMIREENGSVTAHTWSTAAQQWVSVGTVVDAAGSSGNKQEYLGKDYDYVFDVDIEDGKPALKLPYNISQNPYEAATKFIEDNELSMNYLDEVANFITTNTRGTTLGQSSQDASAGAPSGADPWGTESRYRPGDANEVAQPTTSAKPKQLLPQVKYLSITSANVKTIVKKIGEFNDLLLENGPKEACLNPTQMEMMQDLGIALEDGPDAAKPVNPESLSMILNCLQTWPAPQRIPILDLLRLLTAYSPALATPELLSAIEHSGTFADHERPNNQMLACRALANLFQTTEGTALADSSFEQVHSLVKPLVSAATTNRNLTISFATLYINYAVLLVKSAQIDAAVSAERALGLEEDLCAILKREKDSEAIYRCLVALGTLLGLGAEVKDAARQVFGVEEALIRAGSGVKEPRIRNVIAEIREILG